MSGPEIFPGPATNPLSHLAAIRFCFLRLAIHRRPIRTAAAATRTRTPIAMAATAPPVRLLFDPEVDESDDVLSMALFAIVLGNMTDAEGGVVTCVEENEEVETVDDDEEVETVDDEDDEVVVTVDDDDKDATLVLDKAVVAFAVVPTGRVLIIVIVSGPVKDAESMVSVMALESRRRFRIKPRAAGKCRGRSSRIKNGPYRGDTNDARTQRQIARTTESEPAC